MRAAPELTAYIYKCGRQAGSGQLHAAAAAWGFLVARMQASPDFTSCIDSLCGRQAMVLGFMQL